MSFNPESIKNYKMDYNFRFRYETLRSLLNKNGEALQLLTDLEADLNHIRHYDQRIKRPVRKLITETLLMAQELNLLTNNRYSYLYKTIFRLRNKIDKIFKDERSARPQPFVVKIKSKDKPDSKLIGGKAAGFWLLEKYFADLVPPGFVVTSSAYNLILDQDNLHNRIRILVNNLDVTVDKDQFKSTAQTIRSWIKEAHIPEEIEKEIKKYADSITEIYHVELWAVRSSAVCEDSIHSFAGQFDSKLQIESKDLVKAYKQVLSSRFTERAIKYRIHNNFREVDTPMAVLFMPMIDPVAAGVIHTSALNTLDDSGTNTMVVNTVPGLANKMVKGEEQADTFFISKGSHPELIETRTASKSSTNYIKTEKLLEIANIAIQATEKFDHELDIEWAVGKDEKVHLLQARVLNITPPDKKPVYEFAKRKDVLPLLEGGVTIFPGRAEGPVKFLTNESEISDVAEGSIVIVEKPKPEYALLLPKIAALLVIEGNPVGHLATLVREFSVPCIFKIGLNAKILFGKNIISINATKRTVYNGIRWPGIRQRVLDRIASANRHEKSGPLYDLVLRLNLLDPDASSFKARSCKSVHDTLRFMHEMSVHSMFGFGDEQKRGTKKKSRKLKTDLPIKLQIINLDKSIAVNEKTVEPEDVESLPFKALWRGISDKRMFWPEHWKKKMMGTPKYFQEAVLGGNKGPRSASDTNYAIITKDYMNLNARFTYHYTMIDSMIGPGTENNYVHFRFRGGGANEDNRARRARFLESVLRQSGFGVDRRKDLLTAWLRCYPQSDSEKSLEILGRLMVCAWQLDAVLKTDNDIKIYANSFLKEKYEIFS